MPRCSSTVCGTPLSRKSHTSSQYDDFPPHADPPFLRLLSLLLLHSFPPFVFQFVVYSRIAAEPRCVPSDGHSIVSDSPAPPQRGQCFISSSSQLIASRFPSLLYPRLPRPIYHISSVFSSHFGHNPIACTTLTATFSSFSRLSTSTFDFSLYPTSFLDPARPRTMYTV